MTSLENKLIRLKRILKKMGSVVIAYSGGTDSTFLLKVAKDVLNDHVLAVTAISPSFPLWEQKSAKRSARVLGVKHQCMRTHELECADFVRNSPQRCYICKKELFSTLQSLAKAKGYPWVAEASNKDDERDFRPGLRAVRELGVRSPLREAGLHKKEIRKLSKQIGLDTFDKPSFACLASRFPYGQPIERKALRMVEKAEEFLHTLNFTQCRVRYHGSIARIEVERNEIPRFQDERLRKKIITHFKRIGFVYVALDLEGYRTGSMNRELPSYKEN